MEVMEDLINRELVTAWARDLESEHTATRETTRHVTRLMEALRDDLARQNGGGPLHSDVIRGYGRAGYGIGRALVLIALPAGSGYGLSLLPDGDRDPVQMLPDGGATDAAEEVEDGTDGVLPARDDVVYIYPDGATAHEYPAGPPQYLKGSSTRGLVGASTSLIKMKMI